MWWQCDIQYLWMCFHIIKVSNKLYSEPNVLIFILQVLKPCVGVTDCGLTLQEWKIFVLHNGFFKWWDHLCLTDDVHLVLYLISITQARADMKQSELSALLKDHSRIWCCLPQRGLSKPVIQLRSPASNLSELVSETQWLLYSFSMLVRVSTQ